MTAERKEKGLGLLRWVLAGFFAVLFGSPAFTAPTDANFCRDLNNAKALMDNAFASQPQLANNTSLQRLMIAMAAYESSYNPLRAGIGQETGLPVAFGIFQVNASPRGGEYDWYHQAYKSTTGTELTGSFSEKMFKLEAWAASNQQLLANKGASLFLEKVNAVARKGGTEADVLNAYCGGCYSPNGGYIYNVSMMYAKAAQCLGWEKNTFEGGDLSSFPVLDTDSNGKLVPVNCPDVSLAEALTKAQNYYQAHSVQAARAAMDEGARNARAFRPESPLGSVTALLCLQRVMEYQSLISTLLGKAATVMNMLIGLVARILEAVCQYVATAVNNLLNELCIPMPDLPGMPGFDSPERKTCNGYSLADIVSYNARPPQLPMSGSLVRQYQRSIQGTIEAPFTRAWNAMGGGGGTKQ